MWAVPDQEIEKLMGLSKDDLAKPSQYIATFRGVSQVKEDSPGLRPGERGVAEITYTATFPRRRRTPKSWAKNTLVPRVHLSVSRQSFLPTPDTVCLGRSVSLIKRACSTE